MEEEPNVRIEYVGGSLLEVPRALQRGEVVAAMLDVPLAQGDHRTVKIQFMGRECYFSSQLIRLASRLNAVCLPYVARVDRDLCWLKIFPPRTRADNPATDNAEVEEEMMYVFGKLEAHIYAHPEQWWLWNNFHSFAMSSCDMQDSDL
jgi:lauroyl/myristoyl acyltransferase